MRELSNYSRIELETLWNELSSILRRVYLGHIRTCICSNLTTKSREIFSSTYADWEYFSGDYSYPVHVFPCVKPYASFRAECSKWEGEGYRLRVSLIQHAMDSIDRLTGKHISASAAQGRTVEIFRVLRELSARREALLNRPVNALTITDVENDVRSLELRIMEQVQLLLLDNI